METLTAEDRALSLPGLETLRYARHLILPEVGPGGQAKLRAARVLVIGAGGLGSPVALYLAAAGVGTLGLVDFDVVDLTNLQRQVIHATRNVGRSKLESAAERISDLNPHVRVEAHPVRISAANALELLAEYDIVIDGTDNFPTRYLLNDACVLLGKPYVYGSIFRFEGQNSVFAVENGPCYRCLFAEPPPPGLVPSCAEGGVLGVLPGVVGTIQATEAIKLVLGIGDPLVGRLLMFDALRMRFRELKLRRDPDCKVCGDQPTVKELIDYERFCGIEPMNESGMDHERDDEITVTKLKERLDAGDAIQLIDVREAYEWDIGNLGPEGARMIPLAQVPERVSEIDPDAETVVYCRSGARSARAVDYLRANGVSRVRNLVGGLLAWSDEIDPSIPKY